MLVLWAKHNICCVGTGTLSPKAQNSRGNGSRSKEEGLKLSGSHRVKLSSVQGLNFMVRGVNGYTLGGPTGLSTLGLHVFNGGRY